jgi:hypothetical protein
MVARTHGLSAHPLYHVWWNMLGRCENAGNKDFARYGGRGIRVCDRWHDLAVFVTDIERWLGPRPEGMTLDRIFTDHDYRLDNVRWASLKQQAQTRNMPRPRTLSAEPGQRFGHAIVLAEVRLRLAGRPLRGARLRCDCGAEYQAVLSDLSRGRNTSCGCQKWPGTRRGRTVANG